MVTLRSKSTEMLASAGSAHTLVSAEHNQVLAGPQHAAATDEDPPPEGLGPVYLSVFIDVAGLAMCIPVLPYFILNLPGGSPAALGVATSAYSAAAVVGTAVFGRLSDVIGRRRTILISIFGSGMGFVGTAFSTNFQVLLICRTLAGLFGGSIPVAQAYISDVTTERQRPKYFGFIGATIGIAFTFGPATGALLTQIPGSTPQLVLLAAAGFSFLAFMQALVRLKEPEKSGATASSQKQSVFDLLRNSWPLLVLYIASFCNNYNFQVMQTLYALVLQDFFGFGSLQLGFVLVGAGLVLASSQGLLINPLVQRWGELGTSIFGCAVLSMFGVIWPMFNTRAVFFIHLPLKYIYVVGFAVSNTAIPALQATYADPSQRGTILGLGQSVAALSRVASPVVSGWLYEVSMDISVRWGIPRGPLFLGFGQLPFLVGASLSLLAMLLLISLRSHKSQQAHKVVLAQAQLVTQEMSLEGNGALGA